MHTHTHTHTHTHQARAPQREHQRMWQHPRSNTKPLLLVVVVVVVVVGAPQQTGQCMRADGRCVVASTGCACVCVCVRASGCMRLAATRVRVCVRVCVQEGVRAGRRVCRRAVGYGKGMPMAPTRPRAWPRAQQCTRHTHPAWRAYPCCEHGVDGWHQLVAHVLHHFIREERATGVALPRHRPPLRRGRVQ